MFGTVTHVLPYSDAVPVGTGCIRPDAGGIVLFNDSALSGVEFSESLVGSRVTFSISPQSSLWASSVAVEG